MWQRGFAGYSALSRRWPGRLSEAPALASLGASEVCVTISPSARFVLLVIATGADSPSAAQIAERTGLSLRAAKDALAALQRGGLLANDARRGQRPRWQLTGAGSALVEYSGGKVVRRTRNPESRDTPKASSSRESIEGACGAMSLRDRMRAAQNCTRIGDLEERCLLLEKRLAAYDAQARADRAAVHEAKSAARDGREALALANGILKRYDRLRAELAEYHPDLGLAAGVCSDDVTAMLAGAVPAAALRPPPRPRLPRAALESFAAAVEAENGQLKAELDAERTRRLRVEKAAGIADGFGSAVSGKTARRRALRLHAVPSGPLTRDVGPGDLAASGAVPMRGERIRRGMEDVAGHGDRGAVAGSGGDHPRGREL